MNNKSFIFLVCFLLITPLIAVSGPTRQDVRPSATTADEIETGFELHSSEGYNWWSFVPSSLDKNELAYILLDEGHPQIEDYDDLTEEAYHTLERYQFLAGYNNWIIVTVVIPRDFGFDYYPQGLNYHCMRSATPEFYRRPDLKVNNILDGFKNNLTMAGYNVSQKVLVAGYSAGGMWANRYPLLHPHRVKATAIGQSGGWLGVPFEEYSGTTLNWPLGVADLDVLTGEEYDKQDELKEVPQFVFIGEEDTASTYYGMYPGPQDVEIWGDSDPERLENQSSYLKSQGYNVNFLAYPQAGHEYNSEMLSDVWNFFDAATGLDSDRDNLTDDEELYIYGTDIDSADTDGDGYSDYDEIQNGTDPNDENDPLGSPSRTLPDFPVLAVPIGIVAVAVLVLVITKKTRASG